MNDEFLALKVPSPQETFDNLIDMVLVKRILEQIKEKLKDVRYVKANTFANNGDPYIDFGFEGSLTPPEKKKIAVVLEYSGWYRPTILNSDEMGERPGSITIKIYRNPPHRPVLVEEPPQPPQPPQKPAIQMQDSTFN